MGLADLYDCPLALLEYKGEPNDASVAFLHSHWTGLGKLLKRINFRRRSKSFIHHSARVSVRLGRFQRRTQ